MKKPGLTGWIIIAMTAGIITGLLIHHSAGIYWSEHFSDYMSILTDIFLRLIKMIIAPLVFSTSGNGHRQNGRYKSSWKNRCKNTGMVSRRFTDLIAAGTDSL